LGVHYRLARDQHLRFSVSRLPRGLTNFLRITASGFAASLTTTFWDRREGLHQTRLADTHTQYTPSFQQSLEQLHQFGLNDPAAAGAITQTLVGQSYLLSSLDLLYISAWLCVAFIPLCFLVPRLSLTWRLAARLSHQIKNCGALDRIECGSFTLSKPSAPWRFVWSP
jgi:hypothetical protein